MGRAYFEQTDQSARGFSTLLIPTFRFRQGAHFSGPELRNRSVVRLDVARRNSPPPLHHVALTRCFEVRTTSAPNNESKLL